MRGFSELYACVISVLPVPALLFLCCCLLPPVTLAHIFQFTLNATAPLIGCTRWLWLATAAPFNCGQAAAALCVWNTQTLIFIYLTFFLLSYSDPSKGSGRTGGGRWERHLWKPHQKDPVCGQTDQGGSAELLGHKTRVGPHCDQ